MPLFFPFLCSYFALTDKVIFDRSSRASVPRTDLIVSFARPAALHDDVVFGWRDDRLHAGLLRFRLGWFIDEISFGIEKRRVDKRLREPVASRMSFPALTASAA